MKDEQEHGTAEHGSPRDMPGGRAGEPGYVMPQAEKDALTQVVYIYAEREPDSVTLRPEADALTRVVHVYAERDFEAGA
jgi:hypothetical protein